MAGAGIVHVEADLYPLYASPEWREATTRETIRAWDEIFGFRKRDVLKQRAYLFQEGMSVKEVFLLIDGLILLTCATPSLEGDFNLGLRFPGQLIEPCAHNLGMPYSTSAQAIVHSRFLRVSLAEVERRERDAPGASRFFRRMLSRDLYDAALFIVQLRTSTPLERLQRFMHLMPSVLWSKSAAGRFEIRMPLRDKQIADVLGISPRQLRRVKKEMHDRGLLRVSEGHVWSFSKN